MSFPIGGPLEPSLYL